MLHMYSNPEVDLHKEDPGEYWIIADEPTNRRVRLAVVYHPCGHFCHMVICCACSNYDLPCVICKRG